MYLYLDVRRGAGDRCHGNQNGAGNKQGVKFVSWFIQWCHSKKYSNPAFLLHNVWTWPIVLGWYTAVWFDDDLESADVLYAHAKGDFEIIPVYEKESKR